MTKAELEKQWDELVQKSYKDWMLASMVGFQGTPFETGAKVARANVTAIPEVADALEALKEFVYYKEAILEKEFDREMETMQLLFSKAEEALNKLKGDTK